MNSKNQLQYGDTVTIDGESWVLESVRRGTEAKLRHADSPDDWIAMSMRELVRHSGTARRSSTTPLRPEGNAWPADVVDMESHLLEAFRGLPMGSYSTGPRPQFDPDSTNQEQRLSAKIAELSGTSLQRSRKALFELWKAYQAGGLGGLYARMHPRRPRRLAVSKIDPRIVEVIDSILDARQNLATSSRQHFAILVTRELMRRYPGDPVCEIKTTTMQGYIGERDAGRHGFGKGTTRRSAANSPDRQFNDGYATQLGEMCEIDSTELDVQVWGESETPIRPKLTVLLDVASRVPLAWAIHAGDPNGFDHALLLARAIVGRRSIPGTDASVLSASATLPGELMQKVNSYLDDDSLAIPWIFPQSITLDAGADFRSSVFANACRSFGISMVPVAPGDPTSKPHVERFFRTVSSSFATWLKGSTGNYVGNRGRRDSPSLTLDSLRIAFEAWVTKVYLETPHGGLKSLNNPGVEWTPNQMYAKLFQVGPGVQLPFGREEFFALLPTADRVISDSGIELHNRRYDSHLLDSLRNRSLTGATPGSRLARKFPVSFDPYNLACVWVHHPESDEWIECWDTALERNAAWMAAETEVRLTQTFGTATRPSKARQIEFLNEIEKRENPRIRTPKHSSKTSGDPTPPQQQHSLVATAPHPLELHERAAPVDVQDVDWDSPEFDVVSVKELNS